MANFGSVYQVGIDSEEQKVTVSGSVHSATLIKILARSGKHAELWSQKTNQNNQKHNNCIKYDKNKGGQQKQALVKNLEQALKKREGMVYDLQAPFTKAGIF